MIKFYLVLVVCLISTPSFQAFSQSFLKGKLTAEETKEAIPFAALALFSSDSVLVKAEQSDVNGFFMFQNIKEGDYYLSIRYVGFEQRIVQIVDFKKNEKRDLGEVGLQTSVTQLEDVLIESTKPLIEIMPGKTIFNVDSDPSNLGTDGITLLSRAPGISIDPDNNIVFQGRTGVRVY
jgi:iron complex outermembrane recepter protein